MDDTITGEFPRAEIALICAVLDRAIIDLFYGNEFKRPMRLNELSDWELERLKHYRSAKRWAFIETEHEPMSFFWICEALGLVPEHLRNSLKKLLRKGRGQINMVSWDVVASRMIGDSSTATNAEVYHDSFTNESYKRTRRRAC